MIVATNDIVRKTIFTGTRRYCMGGVTIAFVTNQGWKRYGLWRIADPTGKRHPDFLAYTYNSADDAERHLIAKLTE